MSITDIFSGEIKFRDREITSAPHTRVRKGITYLP
ncbi:MAG: hypothetical protein DRO00_04795 [Thermoproteota archaeon]|nr:MAG: hypothetical protein DRO00_04795 [Candidatus Korarchaeota archaeon]